LHISHGQGWKKLYYYFITPWEGGEEGIKSLQGGDFRDKGKKSQLSKEQKKGFPINPVTFTIQLKGEKKGFVKAIITIEKGRVLYIFC